MELADVREEIRTFWVEEQLPFGSGNAEALIRLEQEYGFDLPEPVRRYVREFLPEGDRRFEDRGYWREVFGYRKISKRSSGYGYNPFTSEESPEWNSRLVIGTQEGNPYIVDLAASSPSEGCPVLWAEHGTGEWRFSPVATSIPTFILCTCYVHHAMVHLRKKWPDTVVQSRFLRPKRRQLAGVVSNWLAGKINSCEPTYYSHWYADNW